MAIVSRMNDNYKKMKARRRRLDALKTTVTQHWGTDSWEIMQRRFTISFSENFLKELGSSVGSCAPHWSFQNFQNALNDIAFRRKAHRHRSFGIPSGEFTTSDLGKIRAFSGSQ